MPKALTMEEIAALVKQDSAKKASTGKGTRTKKDPTEPRVYDTWWDLPQSHGSCDNPDCTDPRDGGGYDGTAMVTTIKDKSVCRYCFLSGWLSG